MGCLLKEDQIAEVKKEMVQMGVPVRFQVDGQTVNLTTGERQQRGINVIHQVVYWNFTRETANKIAGWIGAKAVFSD